MYIYTYLTGTVRRSKNKTFWTDWLEFFFLINFSFEYQNLYFIIMLADVTVDAVPPSTHWEAPPALNHPYNIASSCTASNVLKRN